MSESVRSSSCLCGAVELSLTDEPVVMTYCHCESCRRWYSAPVHAGCLWRQENVRIEKGADLLTTYMRTEETGSVRKFCSLCGAGVLVDHPPVAMIDIPVVSVSDLVFEPSVHTHYGEKIISIPDGLPKYKGFMPMVGGTGETLPD
jgi:hypothetical protein